jgi:hypothetical protein|tara:strand:+ start:1251 stop:1823 length:573 start_codon:yes stop_codon:yes gene_type:complete
LKGGPKLTKKIEKVDLEDVGAVIVQVLTRKKEIISFVEEHFAAETEEEEKKRIKGTKEARGEKAVCTKEGLYLGNIKEILLMKGYLFSDVYYRKYKKEENYLGKQAYMIYFIFCNSKSETGYRKARELLGELTKKAVYTGDIFKNPSANGSKKSVFIFSRCRQATEDGNIDRLKKHALRLNDSALYVSAI